MANKTLKAKVLLKDGCWHEIIRRDPGGGARCKYCGDWDKDGHSFGWYCQDSPDHVCHYNLLVDQKNRFYVESINKERIYLPKEYNGKKHTDRCIFCGRNKNFRLDTKNSLYQSKKIK